MAYFLAKGFVNTTMSVKQKAETIVNNVQHQVVQLIIPCKICNLQLSLDCNRGICQRKIISGCTKYVSA